MSEVQRARRTEDTFDRRSSRHDGRRSRSRSRSRERSGIKRKTRDEYEHDSRDRRDRDRDGHRDKRHDSRARSRSPKRESLNSTRQRSPPRGPRSERDRYRERDNDRQGEPRHKPNGTFTPTGPKAPASSRSKGNGDAKSREVKMENGLEEDDEEVLMKKFMGFESFRSTKNTKVPGNDKNYGVRKEKKTEYRQYMNRTGGFNRPLSPG